jgi:hypothetical protein
MYCLTNRTAIKQYLNFVVTGSLVIIHVRVTVRAFHDSSSVWWCFYAAQSIRAFVIITTYSGELILVPLYVVNSIFLFQVCWILNNYADIQMLSLKS